MNCKLCAVCVIYVKYMNSLFKTIISSAKEYCKVTFAFEATNEDELTLKEGDIIHVLSKVQYIFTDSCIEVVQ